MIPQPSTSAIPYSPSPPSSTRSFSSTSRSAANLRKGNRGFNRPTITPEQASNPLAFLESTLSLSSVQQRESALPALVTSFDDILSSTIPTPASPPRATFDHLYSLTTASSLPFSSAILKRLHLLAGRYGWDLSVAQLRKLLEVRVRKQEDDREQRIKRWGPEGEQRVRRGARSKTVTVDRERQMDEVADEYLGVLESAQGGSQEEDAVLLERYSLSVALRLPDPSASTATPPSDRDLATARRASTFLLYSLSLLPPSPVPAPEPSLAASLPLPFLLQHDTPAALQHLSTAVQHGRLITVAAIRAIVNAHYGDATSGDVAESEEAKYAHARSVLDEVCSGRGIGGGGGGSKTGEGRLDALLQRRLEAVSRAEALKAQPTLVFIRWVAFRRWEGPAGERVGSREEQRLGLECGLRYWEMSQAVGRSEWEVNARKYPRSQSARLLQALVLESCTAEVDLRRTEGSPSTSPPPSPSTCLSTAISLALAYLPHPLIISQAEKLLLAATVTSHSPPLAFALFEALTSPASIAFPVSSAALSSLVSPPPAVPFMWTTSLLPSFSSLFRSAAAHADSALPMRLYLSWTASGLSFPIGLWNRLWDAVGARGNLEEVKRLVRDWEETGRGAVSGRIIERVVTASCALSSASAPPLAPATPAAPEIPAPTAFTTRILAPLRLFAFFRRRYAPLPLSPPRSSLPPHLLVPLSAYHSLLRALSRSHTDRRPALRQVWRQMLLDGHAPTTGCYNAVLAANVWRPEGSYSVKDLDAAGVVYNALVTESHRPLFSSSRPQPAPDRETYSLLLHGFLRIATPPPPSTSPTSYRRSTARRRLLTLEAALRTFAAACDAGVGARGHQVARLVRTLAGVAMTEEPGDGGVSARRWEDVKRVQERWWRLVVAAEEQALQEAAKRKKGWTRREGAEGGRRDAEEERKVREELKAEMREMRKVRDEVELMERRWIASLARKKKEEAVVIETVREEEAGGEEEEEVAVELEGAPDDETASNEVFETALLTSATSPPSS